MIAALMTSILVRRAGVGCRRLAAAECCSPIFDVHFVVAAQQVRACWCDLTVCACLFLLDYKKVNRRASKRHHQFKQIRSFFLLAMAFLLLFEKHKGETTRQLDLQRVARAKRRPTSRRPVARLS
jgi:hypothetical protein